MRGSVAKELRKMAKRIVESGDQSMWDGQGQYNTVKNHVEWVPAFNSDGSRMKDPDGTPLKKPEKVDGTVTSAWTFRNLYKQLKKQYMKGKLPINVL